MRGKTSKKNLVKKLKNLPDKNTSHTLAEALAEEILF